MKKHLILILLALSLSKAFAQAPALIPYQAVARDIEGHPLQNSSLSARFTLHEGGPSGTFVWQETHVVSTNSIGLFSVQLGSSSSLSEVNWSVGSKFMQVELDLGNGFVEIGTQQLLSVPFALYSTSSGSSLPGPQGPQGEPGPQGEQGPAGNGFSRISNTNDTLFFDNGDWLIIPGLSASNITDVQYGCTESNACNYSPQASIDNGSCHEVGDLCNDGNSLTVGDSYNIDCMCVGIIDNNLNSLHTCGTTDMHNPIIPYDQLVDQSGNTYKTVQIGNQKWMAENLKATNYQNGDIIPNITNDITWAELTQGGASWWYYLPSIDCPHGLLYNSYAVIDERNVCPVGWRVPSKSDWNKLIKHLDTSADTTCWGCYASYSAGTKLKSTSNTLWNPSADSETTNSTGFSALASGMNNNFPGFLGGFPDFGASGLFYTTEVGTGSYQHLAFAYRLRYDFNGINSEWNHKNTGFSVRCVRE